MQSLGATTLEQICERADVANRSFFNHFPKREDMIRALAAERLTNLSKALEERRSPKRTAPRELRAFFDDIGDYLETVGAPYKELVGAMLAAASGATPLGVGHDNDLYAMFLDLIKEGVAKGEITERHDPSALADIVIGGLIVALLNWTSDDTYSVKSGLHATGTALADLLAPTDKPKPKKRGGR